jgi:sialic acid synthase SpsE
MIKVIAEAGSNHNGEVKKAVELVKIAANAGVNMVKFQFIYPEELYLKFDKQKNGEVSKVFQKRASEQIDVAGWLEVWEEAQRSKIEVTSSVFGESSISLLRKLGSKVCKIASCDANNLILIERCLDQFESIIISTGMSSLNEIQRLSELVYEKNAENLVQLLHCVSLYPCNNVDTSLGFIKTINQVTGLEVGFSDHTLSHSAACAALGLGCRLFEKHFTLSNELPGFDHAHALEAQELHEYNKILSDLYQSVNQDYRKVGKEKRLDNQTAIRARRGVYAAKHIKAGELITLENSKLVRPQTSLSAIEYSNVLGTVANADINLEEPISLDKLAVKGESSEEQANLFWQNEMTDKGID